MTKSSEAYLCLPGKYSASLWMVENGVPKDLQAKTTFELKSLVEKTFPAENPQALQEFRSLSNRTRRDLQAVNRFVRHAEKGLQEAAAVVRVTPGADVNYLTQIRQLTERVQNLQVQLNGDGSLAKREFEVAPSLNDRMGNAVWNSWYYSGSPTGIQTAELNAVRDALPALIQECQSLDMELQGIRSYLRSIGGPVLNNELPVFER
jgi:hypothetical protein